MGKGLGATEGCYTQHRMTVSAREEPGVIKSGVYSVHALGTLMKIAFLEDKAMGQVSSGKEAEIEFRDESSL